MELLGVCFDEIKKYIWIVVLFSGNLEVQSYVFYFLSLQLNMNGILKRL